MNKSANRADLDGRITFTTMAYTLKDRARYAASEAAPRAFCLAERWKNGVATRSVRPYTNIVVEGYPRSANSFTVAVLRGRVGPQWHIAHHIHLPFQIELGVRWKRPVLVLLRAPVPAALSYVSLQLQASLRERRCALTDADLALRLREAVYLYFNFYERVLRIEKGFMIATFELLTNNLGAVFEALSARFQLAVPSHPVTVEERNAVFESSGYHLAPSVERDRYKERIGALYEQAVPRIYHERACAAYERSLEAATKSMPNATATAPK